MRRRCFVKKSKARLISAAEFDEKFDNGDDIIKHLDLSSVGK